MSTRYPNRVLSRFSKQHLHNLHQPRRCFVSSARLADHPQQHPQDAPSSPRTTHFGFENVPESEKASRGIRSPAPSNQIPSLPPFYLSYRSHALTPPQVGKVFTSVAPSYDTMNDLIDTSSHVTITDINASMLSAGRARISASHPSYTDRLSYLEADAQLFPSIADNSIDLYTVAFGIRNFTDIPAALATAYRVLRPGGVFACLEFTPRLQYGWMNDIYKRWSFGAIPLIGQLVAGDRDSYQYLVESIERFPDQERFRGMIEGAGFLVPGGGGQREWGREKGWVNLTGGVAAIHKGVKPLEGR
ncbi:MAG: 2-hexaprenyl-6-methoxy-1,4-benzoquinone methyltransferase [Ramalina farinacea]|uniref:2-hexaprenyl-6-methoxy-1,4-benzoquinone methyltransferase n=1 Tax=Ramalina farinacea TaxID=258253 RepID=A0AA43QSK8_9LECA|nr:2-hexaprenyl-6-methoxy-1,4-benzoquinone methyltransferase [Ramalina farinacea]